MSRLNFAPLSDAFNLGSDKIKNTQEEIDKLRKIISDSSLKPKTSETKSQFNEKKTIPDTTSTQRETSTQRDPNTQRDPSTQRDSVLTDADILKIIQHPRFDDVVKNYIIVKHPEWVNGKSNIKESFQVGGFLKQGFGNTYSTTVCSNLKNYVIFFVISLLVYLLLKNAFNN